MYSYMFYVFGTTKILKSNHIRNKKTIFLTIKRIFFWHEDSRGKMYHATFVKGIGAFLLPTSFPTTMRFANGLHDKGRKMQP